MSDILNDFYSDKPNNTFVFNQNPDILIKEIEVSDANVKITYAKDDGSTILQFVNWTSPAKETGLVSAGAFKVFLGQWVKFGSLFAEENQVKERCSAAAEKALSTLNVGSVADALTAGGHQILMETIVKGVLDLVKGQVYNTRGTLVLGYNQKGYLTPPKFGQSGVYEWPFYVGGNPVLPAADAWFLHTKPTQNQSTTTTAPPVTEEAPW